MPAAAAPSRKASIDYANETLARAERATRSRLEVEILPGERANGKRRCVAEVRGPMTAAELRSVADLMDVIDQGEG